MKITLIELSNWRAYESAIFEFDTADEDKNCVLIGAPNGFGKTSLFEAITLCIYGKKGLPLLARASDTGRVDTPYDKFLSNVIHKNALNSSSRKLAVKIGFKTEDGEKIRVERSWYFSPSGVHKAGDEQFAIWNDGEVQVPEHGQDRDEWEAELINKYFVPHSLAQFFLFDGEMVRDLARMDQATQVKKGIEGLMGVPILRNLIDSLESHSVKKRSSIKSTKSGGNPAKLGEEIENHAKEISRLQEEIQGIDNNLSKLNNEQKGLFSELTSFGTVDAAKKAELYQQQKDAENQRDKTKTQLQEKIVSDFSMGLAGSTLLQNAIEKIEADQILDDWEASKSQGEKGFDNFINNVEKRLIEAASDVPKEYHKAVVELIGSSWDSIWHPMPENCPEERVFTGLHGSLRRQIKDRFNSLLIEAGTGLQTSFEKLDQLDKQINSINSDIKTSEAIGPRQEEISIRLEEIRLELQQLNSDSGAKNKEKEYEESQRNSKKATLEQITGLENDAKPILDVAKRAEHVTNVVRKIIEEIIPLQSGELASKMSQIYLELSNKSAVKRVEIDQDFNVQLIGKNGENLRETEMSAGEEQIFSQALISAVVQVSNFEFPMIVDTPLARLDDAHRTSILNHFKNNNRQVIFLSTDTEIIGKYHDLLKENISNTYKLNHVSTDGIGYTSIEKGYF